MLLANTFSTFGRLLNSSPTNMSRLVLYAGETFSVDQAFHIRVISGTAWITVDDQDIVLSENEAAQINPTKTVGLIGPAGKESVMFELRQSKSLQ